MGGRLVLVLGIMMVIFVLSTIPAQPKPPGSALRALVAATPPMAQKALHFVVYMVLGYAWARAFDQLALSTLTVLVMASSLSAGFGALIEWYQLRIPGRYGTWRDVFIDAAGALLGSAGAVLI